jgi:hypothetical protein
MHITAYYQWKKLTELYQEKLAMRVPDVGQGFDLRD